MMYQYPLRYFLVMIGCLSALLIGCTKDNLEIYNRPESLAAPIYQQLDTKGNFKTLLQVIDKSGYKSVLSTGGYWTLFAPNDDAFAKYFTRKGLTLSSLDSTQAQKMVQSMLVFNAYTKDKLGDYQKTLTGTSGEQSGLPGLGFRRKSAYSKGVYDETSFDGTKYKAVGMNASKRDGIPYSFNAADNNYKYLTYFTDEFMGKKGLGATDYNTFFPNTTYSGFNVMGAKVTEADIVAENGMIHIVDDVVESELSADDYLKTKSEYSTFRNLIEKYAVFFKESLDMTVKYNNRTRTSNKVYIKQFDKFASATGKYLAFNPTSENISSAGDNTESQSDIPTMMAPTNAVLDKYINEVILEKYKSLDELPTEAVIDLINAHLSNNAAWPTKIQSSYNELGEVFQQNVSTDIIEKKLLSNAMFYGTNKVQVANVFSSVYSRIYLDPSYSIMKRIIDMEIKPYLLNPAKKYTLFLISDSDFKTAGYEYNPNQISPNLDQWVYTSPTGVKTTGASVLLNMRRIVGQSVVPYDNGDLTNLASQGVVTSYTGEPIKFNNNVVVSSGIQTSTTPMTVVSKKECSNGVAYYTKGNILNFAPDNTTTATPFLTDLAKLGATTTSPYYQFYQYLKGSSIYQSTTASTILVGIPDGLFYTFLIPDNNAVLAAVKAGLLPVTATKAPNYTPTLITEKAMIDKFVQSHIVKNFVIPVQSNGQKGQFLTLLKSAAGDSYQINIDSNTASGMTIIDPTGRSASINISSSNNISNRTVFHSINNYLLMQ